MVFGQPALIISNGDIVDERNFFGRYAVTDLDICHGKSAFRGTGVLVANVLEQVADGLAWETSIEEWCGSISYGHSNDSRHLN